MWKKSLLWAIGALVAIGAVAAWYYPQVDSYSDIFFYQKMAADVGQVHAGGLPGDPSAWYPPFAGAVFYGVSLMPGLSFVAAWLTFLVLALIAATAYLYWVLKWGKAYLLPVAVLVLLPLLGLNVVLARYDILIGITVVLAWREYVSRRYLGSMIWLVLAIGLKAVPLVLLPVFLLLIPREAWKKAGIGLVWGLLVMIGLPALLVGPKNLWHEATAFASFQGGRGFQVESTWSGIDMLAKNTLNQQALTGYNHFATHNLDMGEWMVKGAVVILVAGLGLLYWYLWKQRGKERKLAPWVAATLLWVFLVAPIFSPQFLMWVLPLVVVWLGSKITDFKHIPKKVQLGLGLVAVVTLATHYLYPWHYVDFLQQTYIFNTVMLNVRNITVLILLWWCLWYVGVFLRGPWTKAWVATKAWLTKPSLPLTEQQKKVAGVVMVAVVVCFIFWICAFKILDRDFWWHIKAGEIMVKTHALITQEPFAYTRAGLPYLATQSWLAEIWLYLIYAAGGSTGIILFRTLSVLVVFGLLLAIDKKRAWFNSLLVILAANMAQPAFIERPQLFTFMLFALFLYLGTRVLKKGLTKNMIIGFVALEVLWMNLHGAASFLGLLVVGALGAQWLYDWWRLPKDKRPDIKPLLRPWLYLAGGMIVALFLAPSGYHNFTYIFSLLSDKTTIFINEWQPRPLAQYMGQMIILWLVALIALWKTRRNWVYNGLLLLVTGYLSRQALRHEVLFVMVAVAVAIYQLQGNKAWRKWLDYLISRQLLAGLIVIVGWAMLAWYTQVHMINFAQTDQLYGYGVFTPAKGAYDFIAKNNLQGNMFNTYGIGGYLLYRGYPDRPVYIDGRNVDYGFDFMNATYQAGLDADHWKALDDKYNFSYAIIDYDAIANVGRAGYSIHLDHNPDWTLVYLDDWTAVYVKNTPANQAVIKADKYSVLNPINFDKGAVLDTLTTDQQQAAITELTRVMNDNPDGVKARLLLARIDIADQKFDEATQLLNQVKITQPHLPDTYELLASIAVTQQQWVDAANDFKSMLAYLGNAYPDTNYAYIASIFSKAGHPILAAYYNWLAKPQVAASAEATPSPTPTTTAAIPTTGTVQAGSGPISQQSISNLFADINTDIQQSNDDGVNLAQQGQFDQAKDKFMHALALDPGNPRTLNNLGALSLQTGDKAAAVDYFKRALQRTDKYPEAHYNLAIAYYDQGDYKDALTEAQKAEAQGYDTKGFVQAIQKKLQ